MLGLTLREEFRGKRLKGTAIELSNDSNTGATQVAAKSLLDITYPTHDLLKAIEAVGPNQGRPMVVIGERGLGKSHLLRLLEDQVLIATDAQETRDMIRILANLYKSRGQASPVLTAADLRLDDDASGIGALLDSVSNEHHRLLRAKAQQNILSVTEAVRDHAKVAPHLQEILGALWLRSIAVGNLAGAEPPTLQADITHDKPIDDNAFQVELAQIPEAIEEGLVNDLFVPEDFADLVLEAAAANSSVGKLLGELQEPRPGGQYCIP